MERHSEFMAILHFKNLLERQIDKNSYKPLKTAKEVMMLVNAILDNFEAFYTLGDNVAVYLSVEKDDTKRLLARKIKDISIGA